mgnify:CR=1 FL=1|jgi:hypothetical protein
MKKVLSVVVVMLVTVMLVRAQAPRMFNYQGVARNSVGNVLGNKDITLRLTIREGGINGQALYSETRKVTTNPFGLFVVQVGGPGASAVTGSIDGIPWNTGNKYLQVEIDPEGGSAFLHIGTTELLSVPFSLYSESGLPIGPAGEDLTGAYPNPTVARIRGVNVADVQPAQNALLGFDGTNWTPTSLATHPHNYWRLQGQTLSNTNDGNTGIGLSDPETKLHVKGSSSGPVATFENTQDGDGDGIVVRLGKTHPRYKDGDYVHIPIPPVQNLESQMNQIRRWVYGEEKFSPEQLVNLIPHQYMIGSVCKLTNLISEQLNNALNLPIYIGPYSTPAYTLIPRTRIFGGLGLPDPLPDIPSISIGPYTIPSLDILPEKIPIFPRIPEIPCGNLPSLDIPVLSFTNVSNSLTKENEFVIFQDKAGRKLGAIRAQSIQDFSFDYFDGLKVLSLAEQFLGLDIVKDLLGVVVGVSEMINDYNNIGVEYSSGNGDYAEWLERLDPAEEISAGDIVGVKGGKITKSLEDADQVMAVSYRPIVLGNMPEKEKVHLGNNVAFMGQIPVKVMGPVNIGDYIVAKSEIPGYGVAVPARQMTTADYRLAVGRAWETKPGPGPKMVNTVVGVHNNDFLRIVDGMQKKIESNEERLRAIETKLGLATPAASKPKKGF